MKCEGAGRCGSRQVEDTALCRRVGVIIGKGGPNPQLKRGQSMPGVGSSAIVNDNLRNLGVRLRESQ